MSESAISAQIRLELAKRGVIMFRNNTGMVRYKGGRVVRFGLALGSSDLIGIRQSDGKFVAIEVKQPGKKPTGAQQMFIDAVKKHNGLAGVAHSVTEALTIIGE